MGKKCLLSTFALYFASHCAQAVAVSPDCASLCTSHQSSPYCLALRKDDARGDAFAKIRAVLANPNSDTIEANSLKAWFGVTDDPCLRGNTLKQGDLWRNKGYPCTVTAGIKFSDSSIPVQIQFPAVMQFTLERQGSTLILMPKDEPVIIQIADGELHNDWGGAIGAIFATQSKAIFQMPRGCIVIPL